MMSTGLRMGCESKFQSGNMFVVVAAVQKQEDWPELV